MFGPIEKQPLQEYIKAIMQMKDEDYRSLSGLKCDLKQEQFQPVSTCPELAHPQTK